MKSVLTVFAAFFAFAAVSGQWTAGMDDDAGKSRKCYYGYSYGGRIIGLSALRGLEAGVRHMME